MNVLHINQSDTKGGAAIAGYRLHQGLLTLGVESRLLVGQSEATDERVARVPRRGRTEVRLQRITKQLGLNYIHLVGTNDIAKHPFYQAADILNFHNLHSGYFSYLAIAALTQLKPAVFTLHDMWSFTGHCAYSYDCDRWKTGCGQCPYPDTYPAIRRDSTRLEWKLKHRTYQRSNLTVVAPSKWLAEQARQSLFQCAIHHIPYGIDTDAYQPLDAQQCRSLLGIPDRKKVLMFGAESFKDARKGSDLLIQSLQALPPSLKPEVMLLILGHCDRSVTTSIGIDAMNLGYVSSDRLKSIAYSAADLFVFPTRADNLPLVLQESMACGTPMVSFKIGGVSDLVRPDVTGYLATPNDALDLSHGIVKLLDDADLRHQMQQNCRAIALCEYPLALQTQRYLDLYREILQT